jgi:M6 family metalloprotease-like protein
MKKLFLLLFISMVCLQTFAVPAYPYPITITQPSGDELTLMLKGDEYMNWAVTLDGYTLLSNAEYNLCYAQLNENGDLVPSLFVATEIVNRPTEVTQWLEQIQKGLFYSDEQVNQFVQIRNIMETEAGNPKSMVGDKYGLLVILMEFPDRKMTKTVANFNILLNQISYFEDDCTGSMKDYYYETSYNKFDVTCTVIGPYTTQNAAAWYAPEQPSLEWVRYNAFAREAIQAAYNDGIDLTPFLTNGQLPSYYAVYAGYDKSACPNAPYIWAHKSQLNPPFNYNGVQVTTYACSSELRGCSGTKITDIGVICHEFGHSIGAPDYYDTNYEVGGEYDGTSSWDIMAGGSWNNSGTTPPIHNPRSKVNIYQWATATTLSTPQKVTVPLSRIYSNAYFKIDIPNSDSFSTSQYFVIENRDKGGFDAYIPGSNLVIYRCTENYMSNPYIQNTTSPQRFYPVAANATVAVPATGTNCQSQYGSINSSSCSWPGTGNKTSFTNSTTPAMVSWGGTSTNKPITNIQVHGDYITFDFMGGGTKSNYHVFLPAYYGCKVTAQSGSTSPVNTGGSFSFQIELLPSHNQSEIKVTANNVVLTPSGNVYTITNIQEDQIVRIEDLKFNTFPISAIAGTNGIIIPEGEVPVNQGCIQSFEIRADLGYSVDYVLIDGVNMGDIKSYTFYNVLEPHSVEAIFKMGGQYTINATIDEAFFETCANIPSESIETIITSPGLAGNITAKAPLRFEISQNGISWYKEFIINKNQLPYKLYIRFFPPWGSWNVGTFTGDLTLKSIEAQKVIRLTGLSHIGIDETDNDQGVTIYPNPTTGELQVTSDKLQVTGIEIFDVYGRNVLSHTAHRSPQTVLNIAHLNAGIYMMTIHTDKGIVHKKVVKE